MRPIIILGIIFCLIISSLCDDCSSKKTESECTGSCKWTAGTSATCAAKTTCALNNAGTACVSTDGCSFTAGTTVPASCDAKCTESLAKADCEAAGCSFD